MFVYSKCYNILLTTTILLLVASSSISQATPPLNDKSTFDELTQYGQHTDPSETLEFVRTEHSQCSPGCRRMVLRYFHKNPSVTEQQLEIAIDLQNLLGEQIGSAIRVSFADLINEAPRFTPYLSERANKDAKKYLDKSGVIDSRALSFYLSNLFSTLIAFGDGEKIKLIERVIHFAPTELENRLIRKLLNCPLFEKMNNYDLFVDSFKLRSKVIYDFINRMSWWHTFERLHDEFIRGFRPPLKALVDSITGVLDLGTELQIVAVLAFLEQRVTGVANARAQLIGTPELLASQDIHRALKQSINRFPSLETRINRLVSRMDWIQLNLEDVKRSAAHSESKECASLLGEIEAANKSMPEK